MVEKEVVGSRYGDSDHPVGVCTRIRIQLQRDSSGWEERRRKPSCGLLKYVCRTRRQDAASCSAYERKIRSRYSGSLARGVVSKLPGIKRKPKICRYPSDDQEN